MSIRSDLSMSGLYSATLPKAQLQLERVRATNYSATITAPTFYRPELNRAVQGLGLIRRQLSLLRSELASQSALDLTVEFQLSLNKVLRAGAQLKKEGKTAQHEVHLLADIVDQQHARSLQLQKQNEELSGVIDSHRLELSKSQNEFYSSLERTQQQERELKAALEARENDLYKSVQQLNSLSEEFSQSQKLRIEAEKQLKKTQLDAEEARNSTKTNEVRCSRLQELHAALTVEKTQLKEQNVSLHKQVSDLEQKLRLNESTVVQQIKAENEALKSHLQQKNDQSEQLQRQLQTLQTDRQLTAEHVERMKQETAIQKRLTDQIEATLKQKQLETDLAERRLQEFSLQLNEIEMTLQSKQSQLANETQSGQQLRDVLTKRQQTITQQDEQLSKQKSEIATLSAKLEEMTEEVEKSEQKRMAVSDECDERNAEMNAMQSKLTSATLKAKQAENIVQEAAQQKQTLQKQLEIVRDELRKALDECAGFEMKLLNEQTRADQLEKKSAEYEAQLRQLSESNKRLNDQVQQQQQLRQQTDFEKESMKTQLQKFNSEKTEMQQREQNLTNKAQAALLETQNLRAQLQNALLDANKQQEAARALEKQYSADVQQQKNAYENLKRQFDDLQFQQKQQASQLDNEQHAYKESKKVVDSIKVENAIIKQEAAEYRKLYLQAQAESSELTTRVSAFEKKVSMIEPILKQKDEEVRALGVLINEKNDALASIKQRECMLQQDLLQARLDVERLRSK